MSDEARQLVAEMVAAGEWPDPDLIQRIIDQGEPAVDPLLEIIRRTDPDEAGKFTRSYAVGILEYIGSPRAARDLGDLMRRSVGDDVEIVGEALRQLGSAVVEPLLDIIADRSLDWYPRAFACELIVPASAGDSALRARATAVLRDALTDLLGRVGSLSPDDEFLLGTMAHTLAQAADPEAKELVRRAVAAQTIRPPFIDQRYADELYARGGETLEPDPEPNWLEQYRENYRRHLTGEDEQSEEVPGPASWISPEEEEPFEPERGPEPFRLERRIGRNDPCWCGSGKKYKNCHLKSDREQSF